MGKVPLDELPKVDYTEDSEEPPPTMVEWLDDNSRILFATIASFVAIVIFASIVLSQLPTKSTNAAAAATATSKSSPTTVAAEKVTKDSVKSKSESSDTKENSSEKPSKTDKNNKDD